jgi:bifunctional non-homologous end joining protein LigD
MSLAKYRSMRDFSRTEEPKGKAPRPKRLAAAPAPGQSFVIQKHAARRLHYDFRLELDGELLSWAVPKGPSENPADKRLAVEVEPHPLEYGKFEGTIPAGEYGAGKVEIWDRGRWLPEGDPREGLRKGHLKFSLAGERLSGTWHLVRTRGARDGKGTDKSWLLFKSPHDSSQEATESESTPAPRKSRAVTKAPTDPLPETIEPELATLVDEAPAGDDWVHEIKLDGYRLFVRFERGEVTLLTRNGKDWTEKFPSLRAACEELALSNAIIDGELVALDAKGVSHFQDLQGSLKDGRDAALVYYAFDLLHDGKDLRDRPLLERKSRLRELLERHGDGLDGRIRFSAHVVGQGPEFFENAGKVGLEGTIAKRGSSPYRGGRGRDWLKIKTSKRQELVIVGYTSPAGSRQHLGALLLGVHEGKKLRYAGKVGTGFSDATLRDLHQRLKPLATSEPSVVNPPRGAEGRNAHWVAPELVAEVVFTEVTGDGMLRHPRFVALREDKPAREVELDTAVPLTPIEKKPKKAAAGAKAPGSKPTAKSASDESAAPAGKAAAPYPITNPTKVLYPEDGITKRELLDYYALVAERMLPHVRNRPLTLVRCPNGYDKQRFFQKHPGSAKIEGLRSIAIREKEGKSPYSVLDDEVGLFALVQMAALEVHTWGSRADDFERPDTLVFDLDPDVEVGYPAVIEAALTVKRVFDSAKLESFVKSTGGKGLHVCIPILPKLHWDAIRDFTGRVAQALVQASPDLYVATQSKAKRRGKTFIDYLRNGRGATFIAPYSTRARAGAPIAVPLEWDELSPKLPPSHFTVRNIEQRLAKLQRDPFERMALVQQSLNLKEQS